MKLKKKILMLLMSSTALISTGQIKNPFTDPNNTGNWVLNNEISDEFNGNSLDESKWIIQGKEGHFENRFKGRAPSQFSPQNVAVSGGKLTITTKWQPNYNFANENFAGYKYENITTAAIISRKRFNFGYMEIKCIAADGPVASAFWTTGGAGEIDVFEHYGDNPNRPSVANRYHTSFHDWRTPGTPTYGKRIWTNEHLLPFRVASEEHVYGLEWNPNFLKIYVDNILVKCITRAEIGNSWVATGDHKVWVDSEVFPWEENPANLRASHFPGGGRKYIVDYVRIWQKNGSSTGCQNLTNLVTNPSFENNLNSWTTTGNPRVVNNVNASYAGNKHICLPSGSVATIQQRVTVKPNTTYILRAWGKAPASNFSAGIFHDGDMGVKNYGGPEQKIAFFAPYWHTKSIQFKTGTSTTQATIYYSNQNSSEPTIVDDFSLEEAKITGTSTPNSSTALVKDRGFESGNLSKWNNSYGNVSVVSNNIHSGTHAVYLNGNGAAAQTITGLQPNTQYTLSGWGKLSGSGQDAYLGVKDFGGSEKNAKFTNTAYRKLNIDFKTGASNTTAVIYIWNGNATHKAYGDDFSITKVGTTPSPTPTPPSSGGINCSSIPVWRKSNTFTIGNRVKRNNVVYQLRQGAGKCVPGGSSDCSRNQWNKVGDCGSSKNISTKDTEVKLYPNPAVNQVNIISSAGASISIIDLNGKVVLTQIAQGEITLFNLNGVTKGMYLVKIEVKGGIVFKKLVVN